MPKGMFGNHIFMKLLRNQVKLKKMTKDDDPFVNLPPSECISFIWELTLELWSLKGSPYVERRLQRNVANLVKQ